MKSTLLWALIVLNVALLSLFIGRITHDNAAIAQPAPAQRRMGDYLTISGNVQGGTGGVVYIIDTSNEILGAMAYDDSRGGVDVMPVIDLKRVFQQPPPAKSK